MKKSVARIFPIVKNKKKGNNEVNNTGPIALISFIDKVEKKGIRYMQMM